MTTPRIPMTRTWGVRLAFATALISGVAVWLNGTAVREVGDPAVYTTLKNLIAAGLLIAAAAATGARAEARTLRRDQWGRLLLIGVIGGSIPFLLFFTGLSMATAPSAAFIHKTLFIWVALMAVPLLGERLGWLQIGALGVLLVGQVLLVAPSMSGAVGIGELMILAATLLWSLEVIVAKRLLGGVSAPLAGAARLGFGVVILAGFVVVSGKLDVLAGLGLGAVAWVLLTGVILAGFVGTWYAALARAPAVVVTSVLVVGAVVTAGLNVVARGVRLDTPAAVGALAIIAGVGIVALSASRIGSRPWARGGATAQVRA